MKTYSAASDDVMNTIERMFQEHHQDLDGVTIGGLFVFDTEATVPVLKHGGYPAAAVIRITPIRERTQGIADCVITVDRAYWMTLAYDSRAALIDHELTHITRAKDKDSGAPLTDAVDRPLLKMRKHDFQMGWFTEVAERHGAASIEVKQATQIIQQTGQLYFDFGPSTPRFDRLTGELLGGRPDNVLPFAAVGA